MNKKADMNLDILLLIVFMLVFAVLAVVGHMVYSDVNADIQADSDMHAEAKALSQDTYNSYDSIMDNAFVFFFILMWLAMIVTSLFLDSHPVFFIISVLILGVIIYIGAEISNAFTEIVSDSSLAAGAVAMPMTLYMMQHLVLFIVFMGFSVGIALYAKFKGLV